MFYCCRQQAQGSGPAGRRQQQQQRASSPLTVRTKICYVRRIKQEAVWAVQPRSHNHDEDSRTQGPRTWIGIPDTNYVVALRNHAHLDSVE